MEQYDLAIIGGGPAGYLAAERAAARGLKTALFEERELGGVCLNEGCIPTKTLLYSAKLLTGARHGEAYGIRAAGAELALEHGAVLARKAQVVRTLVSGVGAKLRAAGAAVYRGRAEISGKCAAGYLVTQNTGEGAGRQIEAARLLLAAGSEPVVPSIPGLLKGLESGFALTSREALELPAVPARLVIVGGGVIGLEMADYFNAAGSRVTVVELLDKIAGPMDGGISKILLGNLQKKGIEFLLGRKVTAILPPENGAPGGVQIEAAGAAGAQVIPADRVLLAIGRRPRITGFGLEALGVYTERGAVVTDGQLRTNLPNVYAAGDINGKYMLAHTAYREAEVAVAHMLGLNDSMRYDAISSVVYTNPEAAGVGETEESAAAKGITVKAVSLSMRYAGRYAAENEGGDGICKLVADMITRRVIGAHMIGGSASEIILSAAFMIESRLPVEALRTFVFPHPTAGEILREALFQL